MTPELFDLLMGSRLAAGDGVVRWFWIGNERPTVPGVDWVESPDLYTALYELQQEVVDGCMLHAPELAARPHAALSELVAVVGEGRVFVVGELPNELAREAVAEFDVPVMERGEVQRRVHQPRVRLTTGDETEGGSVAPAPTAGSLTDERGEANALAARLLERIARHQPVASTVLRAFVKPTGAQRASLVLRAADRGLRMCEAVGVDKAVERKLGDGLQGELDVRAVRLGRAIAGHGEQGGERDYPGTAFLVLPLYAGSKFEGVINLTGLPGDRLPDDNEMARLTLLAEQAAHGLRTWRQLTRAVNDSVHDPLTGLANRRAFERALRRELDRAERDREHTGDDSAWIGVALLDLDHFKSVNDNLGHEAGDRVLHEVAQRLRAALRDLDVVARWGGEEFAVILPLLHLPEDAEAGNKQEAAEAATAAILERARLAVSDTPVDLRELAPPHSVTISGGYVVGPLPGQDGTALMGLADAALYQAKDQGRDRIIGGSQRRTVTR